jgi:hypothetical protein
VSAVRPDHDWSFVDPDVPAPPPPTLAEFRPIRGNEQWPPHRQLVVFAAPMFTVIAVVLFVVDPEVGLAVLGLVAVLLALAGLLRWQDRRLAAAAPADGLTTAQRWSRAHRVDRHQFPATGPAADARRLADAIVAETALLRSTRIWPGEFRENWDWALNRQAWALLVRLRDSIGRRVALAEAHGRVSLADEVAVAGAQIEALDVEAEQFRRRLTELAGLACHLDRTRADAERDAELRAELTSGVPVAGYEPASTDLRLLLAQLAALTDRTD